MTNKVSIYTCQRMTGRFCDEMRQEADMLVRVLDNYGFKVLNPVIEESVPYKHELLENVNSTKLETYWRRDKEMIRESDILLDYRTQNASDGSNNEVAYSRWCLWKPTVRVWEGKGALISRIEDDLVVPDLLGAMALISDKWGTYEKLGAWRDEMMDRCYKKWIDYQVGLDRRYHPDRDCSKKSIHE